MQNLATPISGIINPNASIFGMLNLTPNHKTLLYCMRYHKVPIQFSSMPDFEISIQWMSDLKIG